MDSTCPWKIRWGTTAECTTQCTEPPHILDIHIHEIPGGGIWYDTEFLEDGKTIELISIGLVAEIPGHPQLREYYAVNEDIGYFQNESVHNKIRSNYWLMKNVIQKLGPVKTTGSPPEPNFTLDSTSVLVKPKRLIANEVREFILEAENPELRAWYAAYDHVALMQLWGPMARKPEGIPMWTYDLKQECERLGNPEVPQQDPENEHNALADAHHDRKIEDFLQAYAGQLSAGGTGGAGGGGARYQCVHQSSNFRPCPQGCNAGEE